MPAAPGPQQAFQTILKGRKCYRLSKDKNEVVWPPHLEAALMEGLEQYKPAESKSPRGLTRFPNRNKFIADFILKATGEARTAKQVGSRIQQLRDTSAGKAVMKVISDRHYEMMHPTKPAGHEFSPDPDAGAPMKVHVWISVPPAAAGAPSAYPQQAYGGRTATDVAMLSPSMYEFHEPRPLRTIDPTVAFRAHAALPLLLSRFTVFCGTAVVHVDQPAPMAARAAADGSVLYYARLAPGYWDELCSCPDLSMYTVMQEITKQQQQPGTDAAASPQKAIAVMEIQYHFNTSAAPPLSPFALNEDDLEIDYESDDMFQPLGAPPLSTCSDSPYGAGDRGSSPAYSIPPGFASQPLSPVEWVPTTAGAGAGAGAAHTWALSQQHQQLQGAGFYSPPPPQHPRYAPY